MIHTSKTKLVVRTLLALLFVVAGVLHFTHTSFYAAIMPPYLPQPHALILISGVCEIIGGAALLIPRLRRLAGYGLIALLLAVFPANIQMLISNTHADAPTFPTLLLWLRLPLQFVLIAIVWWCSREKTPQR
jgi:uncharacterized membrane protein